MATGAVPTGLATLLPPECTDTVLDFRRALRRNRTHIIRLSIGQGDTGRETVSNASSSAVGRNTSCSAADITLDTKAQANRLEEEEDGTSSHHPTPLNLPLPALARIVHYFSTSSSWQFTS